ncbi:uncharacterized protein LOC124420230 [Lucilia cuprina]|uniref:uncharacterized protein LOC124420230 n=1 Tax=Lucilia cuprina TaxID=7375 RepID=UPI001F06EE36|nr:uncharacterized protein LOC124420230 [Lucilia cuprina]
MDKYLLCRPGFLGVVYDGISKFNTSTPTGITPPPHQLSVTWATPPCGTNERELKIKPIQTSPGGNELNENTPRKRSQEEKPHEYSLSYVANNLTSPVVEAFIGKQH